MIQARLDLQSQFGVDLIGVSKETGERQRGKFVAETNLRKAIKDLMQGVKDEHGNLVTIPRSAEFGQDARSQFLTFSRYVGDGERQIIPLIEQKEKEKADLIKKYRNKVGVLGGLATFGAAALGPVAGKLAKHGYNEVANHFGWAQADVSKTTWLQESLRYIKEGKHYTPGTYSGALLDRTPVGFSSKINLPPGFSAVDQGVDSHMNRLFGIVDSKTGALLIDKVPMDNSGNIVDPHAFDSLKHAGWNITETAGVPGGKGSILTEAQLRADGFAKNVRHDWHHITDWDSFKHFIFNGKELSVYKTVTGGGAENWDASRILRNLTDNAEIAKLGQANFGIDTEGNIDPKMEHLRDQLLSWYNKGGQAEIAKHLSMRIIASEHDNAVTGLNKIVGSFDSSGHMTLDAKYANAAYKEIAIIDDTGQAHILATEHVPGREMLGGGSGGPGAIDLRPPVNMEEPYILAGSIRDTDKAYDQRKIDAEEKRKKEEADAKNQHNHNIDHNTHKDETDHSSENHGHGDEHGHGETKPEDKNKEPHVGKEKVPDKHGPEVNKESNLSDGLKEAGLAVKEQKFDRALFESLAKKHNLEQEPFALAVLNELNIDVEKNTEDVQKILKENGLKAASKVDLYLVMISLEQHGFGLQKKGSTVVEKKKDSERVEEQEELDGTEEFDEKAEVEKAKKKMAEKAADAKKTQPKDTKEVKNDKAGNTDNEGTKKPADKKPEVKKVVDLNKLSEENENLVKLFAKENDLENTELTVDDKFIQDFNQRSKADNELFLNNFADVIKKVKKELKITNKLKFRLVKTGKLERDKENSSIILIPINLSADKLQEYLANILKNPGRASRSRPGPKRKAA
jgi:hypothetical protein